MGDALVMMTVSEEMFALQGLHDRGPDWREIRLTELYNREQLFAGSRRQEILQRHPNAYYVLHVRPEDV